MEEDVGSSRRFHVQATDARPTAKARVNDKVLEAWHGGHTCAYDAQRLGNELRPDLTVNPIAR